MAKQQKNRKKKPQDETTRHKKTFWKIFTGVIGFVFLVFLLASWGILGSLPDETSLENPEKNKLKAVIENGEIKIS